MYRITIRIGEAYYQTKVDTREKLEEQVKLLRSMPGVVYIGLAEEVHYKIELDTAYTPRRS